MTQQIQLMRMAWFAGHSSHSPETAEADIQKILKHTNKGEDMTYKTKEMRPATCFKTDKDTPPQHRNFIRVQTHYADGTASSFKMYTLIDVADYIHSLRVDVKSQVTENWEGDNVVVHIWEKGVNK